MFPSARPLCQQWHNDWRRHRDSDMPICSKRDQHAGGTQLVVGSVEATLSSSEMYTLESCHFEVSNTKMI